MMRALALSFTICLLLSACAEDIPELLTEQDLLDIIGPQTEPEPIPMPQETSEPADQTQPEPEPEPEPVPVERDLLNTIKKIPAGNYESWRLFLTKASILHGDINLNQHDINVWLMSPAEYENFKAGLEFFPYREASRERTASFSFDFTVPETGFYYFALDNKFSWFTSKMVAISLKVIE